MSDTLAAGSAAMSKEEKKRLKQEKREKKERESRNVDVPVAENKAEESKEERRARKEAKKAAKAAAKEDSGEVSAGKEEVAATGESKSEKKEKRKGKGKEKEESKQEVAATNNAASVSGGAEVQVDKSEGEVTSKKDKKEKKDKKDKKRKRDEDGVQPEESSTATVEGASGPVAAEEQAKKKKKDKKAKGTATSEGEKAEKGESTGVFADESLSEQAQKALHYVEEHATHHLGTTAVAPGKGWKFNKARQNWLLRHIWSETEVPEKYVEGVMRYLNTMKGAGRAELLNTAKKYAAAQGPSVETAKEGGEDGDATAEVAGDEAKADGADGTQEVQDAGEAGIEWEARKQRAERMLGVMESA